MVAFFYFCRNSYLTMEKSISELQCISKNIRKDIIRSLAEAGSGHTGGSLGLADVFAALYFNILNHKPAKPNWEDRDRFILSKGHSSCGPSEDNEHLGSIRREHWNFVGTVSVCKLRPEREYRTSVHEPPSSIVIASEPDAGSTPRVGTMACDLWPREQRRLLRNDDRNRNGRRQQLL